MRLLSDSIEDFIKALMEDEQDQQQAIGTSPQRTG